MTDDIDSQLAQEQFGNRFTTCVNCGLHSHHDHDYKPMRVAWKDWCYTCQIKQEVALTRSRYDTELAEPSE